jgi:hypothetical protein
MKESSFGRSGNVIHFEEFYTQVFLLYWAVAYYQIADPGGSE